MSASPQNPAAPGTTPAAPGVDTPKPDTVSRDAYEAAVTEAKNAKAAKVEAEAKLKAIADADAKKAEADALARNEHVSVIAAKEKSLAEANAKVAEMEERETNLRKLSAFNRAIGVQLPHEYMALWDPSQIEINQDGTIRADSLTKYAEGFKTKYAAILAPGPSKGVPSPNPQGTPPSTGTLTEAEFAKLPLDERRKRASEMAAQVAAKRAR